MTLMRAPPCFQAAEAMQAVVFGGLSGWLHAPAAKVGDVGVVICAPLGRDARCVHLPMRLFAERLATAGFATLRYDHADTGDSLDRPAGADLTPEWLAGVRRASAYLRGRTGVRRIVLCGVRLGATFAAVAAEGADGLILFAPVVSGRSWMRKLRFSARAGVGGSPAGADADMPDADALDTDGLELSPATARSLAGLDLLQTTPPAQVLLVAQGRITDGYARRVVEAGAELTQTAFPGHDALFLDAHSNLAPDTAFDEALAWLERSFPCMDPPGAPGPRPSSLRPTGSPPAEMSGDGFRERAVRFGPGLHGVLCAPSVLSPDRRAVLFCNTGGDPRAGIGRFATWGARTLAQRGVASLRFDFAGLGDSPAPSGEARSHVYETGREPDMDAAVALMRERGFDRLSAVGVCAGAYHALRAAFRDPRIEGAFAISPAKLVWRRGDSLDPERIDIGRATVSYLVDLRNGRTWLRLLRGGVDVGAVTRNIGARLQARLAARRDGQAEALRRDVRRLSERGGRACLFMGVDDVSLDETATYFGPRGARFRALPGMSVQVAPGLDHGLARSASRAAALQALWAWLDQG